MNAHVSGDKIWLPTLGKEIDRPWFLPSQEALDEQQRLLSHTYFLVKQGDAFGERLRCVRCNGRHAYITLMCVEQPFTGMMGGLYAYYRAIKDHYSEVEMTTEQLSRFKAVSQALNMTPSLGNAHPQMARKMMQDLGPTDMLVGAVSLGVLEGIAAAHAAQLVQKINDRGLRPKLVLNAPNGAETVRAREYAGRAR